MSIKFPQLDDGGSFIMRKEHDVILHKCCGCGLKHEIAVEGREGDLKLTFKRINGEPNTDVYEDIGCEIIPAP